MLLPETSAKPACKQLIVSSERGALEVQESVVVGRADEVVEVAVDEAEAGKGEGIIRRCLRGFVVLKIGDDFEVEFVWQAEDGRSCWLRCGLLKSCHCCWFVELTKAEIDWG